VEVEGSIIETIECKRLIYYEHCKGWRKVTAEECDLKEEEEW
jgi:hypothetical protein